MMEIVYHTDNGVTTTTTSHKEKVNSSVSLTSYNSTASKLSERTAVTARSDSVCSSSSSSSGGEEEENDDSGYAFSISHESSSPRLAPLSDPSWSVNEIDLSQLSEPLVAPHQASSSSAKDTEEEMLLLQVEVAPLCSLEGTATELVLSSRDDDEDMASRVLSSSLTKHESSSFKVQNVESKSCQAYLQGSSLACSSVEEGQVRMDQVFGASSVYARMVGTVVEHSPLIVDASPVEGAFGAWAATQMDRAKEQQQVLCVPASALEGVLCDINAERTNRLHQANLIKVAHMKLASYNNKTSQESPSKAPTALSKLLSWSLTGKNQVREGTLLEAFNDTKTEIPTTVGLLKLTADTLLREAIDEWWWPKVQHVLVEECSSSTRLQVRAMLEDKGFAWRSEEMGSQTHAILMERK